MLEVVVVVGLIGLLTLMVAPSIRTAMAESQLEADQNRLYLDLQWAKTLAPSQSKGANRTGTRMFVVFDTTRSLWEIYQDNGDSTYNAGSDLLLKRDSLSRTSRFGFPSGFSLPP